MVNGQVRNDATGTKSTSRCSICDSAAKYVNELDIENESTFRNT